MCTSNPLSRNIFDEVCSSKDQCTTWTYIYEPHLLKMVHLSLDSGYLLHCSQCTPQVVVFSPFFFIQPTLVVFLRTSQDCRSLWTRFSFFPSSNVQTCFFCERKIKLVRMNFFTTIVFLCWHSEGIIHIELS